MPISHPALYDAVHARMRDLLVHIQARTGHGRQLVYRAADATFTGRRGADDLRTPFRSSTNDNNRWTGPRTRTATTARPAAGGVYTSLGMNDALLGEVAFYAFSTTLDEDVQRQLDGKPTVLTAATFSPTLAGKRIFEYGFNPGLRIADLSLSGSGGRALLRALESEATVRAALRTAGYASATAAYLANGDHSVPRAMSQAVFDYSTGFQAIWVTSARADAARALHDDEGDNIVFFGPDGIPINALVPKREISFVISPRGAVRHVVATW